MTVAPSAAGFVRGRMIMVARRKALVTPLLPQQVYRKTMKLSSAGKASVETGQIINMLSADAGNAMEQSVFKIVPLIMGIPIMVVALILLYFTIGASMFAGFAFLVITIPVNLKIFRTVVHWYREAVTRADKRVKLVNELITGIRIVKFYAWEKPFKKMIEGVRGVELQAIEKARLLDSMWYDGCFYANAAAYATMCVHKLLSDRKSLSRFHYFHYDAALQCFKRASISISERVEPICLISCCNKAYRFFLKAGGDKRSTR